jgi:hypothetical protein
MATTRSAPTATTAAPTRIAKEARRLVAQGTLLNVLVGVAATDHLGEDPAFGALVLCSHGWDDKLREALGG